MTIDRFNDAIRTVVIGAIVDDNASKILIGLILDGPNGIGDEARIIPVYNNDIYGRLFDKIIQNAHADFPKRPRNLRIGAVSRHDVEARRSLIRRCSVRSIISSSRTRAFNVP